MAWPDRTGNGLGTQYGPAAQPWCYFSTADGTGHPVWPSQTALGAQYSTAGWNWAASTAQLAGTPSPLARGTPVPPQQSLVPPAGARTRWARPVRLRGCGGVGTGVSHPSQAGASHRWWAFSAGGRTGTLGAVAQGAAPHPGMDPSLWFDFSPFNGAGSRGAAGGGDSVAAPDAGQGWGTTGPSLCRPLLMAFCPWQDQAWSWRRAGRAVARNWTP